MRTKSQIMQSRIINESRARQNLSQKGRMRIFGWLIIIYQIAICFFYGFFLGYQQTSTNNDDLLIPAAIAVLALLGLGLMNISFEKMTIGGMGFSLLLFSITIQQFFLSREFWVMAGAYSITASSTFGQQPLNQIQLSNSFNDRFTSDFLASFSLSDATACCVSLLIAFNNVLGRVGPLHIFILGTIGTFFWQLNLQLLWRIFVTDCGFAMRIFLFGSTLGMVSSLILQEKSKGDKGINLTTNYFTETYALLGMLVVFCLFPALCVADLQHDTSFSNDGLILHAAALNMWFALIAGALGAYCASLTLNGRFSVWEITYSALAGGISYSSSADLLFNPALPIVLGTIVGFLATLGIRYATDFINKKGVLDTNGTFVVYFMPSVIAGIVSSIVQASGDMSVGAYQANTSPFYNNFQAGGIQIAGMGITIGLGVAAGIIIGLLYKLTSQVKESVLFTDQCYYEGIGKKQR